MNKETVQTLEGLSLGVAIPIGIASPIVIMFYIIDIVAECLTLPY